MALTTRNQKNSGVNAVFLSVKWPQLRVTGKITALTEFNRKNSGVNCVQPEHSGVHSVELGRWWR